MGETRNRHSFRPLLFVPPQGPDALPETVREPRASRVRARDACESHVRLQAVPAASIDWLDAVEVLDELGDEQLALGVALSCLEQAIAFVPRAPAMGEVLFALNRRARDLGAYRDALAAVQIAAIDRTVQRVFSNESVLADYLRGLYAWAHAVVRALEELATSLRVHRPDWAAYRFRVEEAKNFHFDDLADAIRADIATLPDARGRDELVSAIEQLFAAARVLEARLDERLT